MALRIRTNGDIFCAALNKEENGDIYINDDLHYLFTVVKKIIVTQAEPAHSRSGGQWWFKYEVPEGIKIEKY